MHGADEGKKWRSFQSFTYSYNFFTDPTISTLTSGTQSMNTDLAGMSFPRRLGVRLAADFVTRYGLLGKQCIWTAYSDNMFKESLGKDFYHEDMIVRSNWCKYYVNGIFPKDEVYLKCEIRDPAKNQLLKVFYFAFKKNYRKTIDGRLFIKDPILSEKIVSGGFLTEMIPVYDKNQEIISFKNGVLKFKEKKITNVDEKKVETVNSAAIISQMVRYTEKPRIVFLITPPHLTSYAQLILIMLKQLVDLNFEQSYMAKKNQKP